MVDNRGGYLRFWSILALVAAGIALPGCSGAGDGLPRQPLAGRVLLDGQPLSHGMIMFYPEEASTKQHETVPSGNSIVNGWFSIPRNKGPVPGKYKIAVSSEKIVKRRLARTGKPRLPSLTRRRRKPSPRDSTPRPSSRSRSRRGESRN